MTERRKFEKRVEKTRNNYNKEIEPYTSDIFTIVQANLYNYQNPLRMKQLTVTSTVHCEVFKGLKRVKMWVFKRFSTRKMFFY